MGDLQRVDAAIVGGVQEVFSTMLLLEVDGEAQVPGSVAIISNISSMIGLGGDLRGMLAIHCPRETACGLTSAFLGLEVAELDDDVKDAMGEVANMVAGCLKESFAGANVKAELAIPTSVIGDSFRVAGLAGAIRHLVQCRCASGIFWVELLYAQSE